MKLSRTLGIGMLVLGMQTLCATAQSTFQSVVFKPATVLTATNQTGPSISLGTVSATVFKSYSVCSFTVTGSSLTTATIGVNGSTDGGVSYHPLPINAIASPGTISTTITVTANGTYQVPCATITNLQFVSSGTFTATNVTLLVTASPNGNISRGTSGSGGGGTLPLLAGVIADYQMQDDAGTALSDSSGHGYNGTLGAGSSTQPTWVLGGLQFTAPTNGVELPTPVNAAKAVCLAAYFATMYTATQGTDLSANVFPTILNSTLADPNLDGINLQYDAVQGSGVFGLNQLTTLAAAGFPTKAAAPFTGGYHSLCWAFGSSGDGTHDTYVMDGVEQPYAAQGQSFGAQSSGNYYLGSINSGNFANNAGFLGTMYRFTAYSIYPTVAQMDAFTLAQTTALAATRGTPIVPPVIPQNLAQLHAIGDSITCSYNGTSCDKTFSWAAGLTLTNQPTYTVNNWGIFGATPSAVSGSEAWRVGPLCRTQKGAAVAIVELGINTGIVLNETALQAWQDDVAEIQVLKTYGCRVLVGSILSATGNAVSGGTLDEFKDAYDAYLLQQAKLIGADGVVDFAANPLMGADGASTNTTYFQNDGIHPTAAGQAQMSIAASNAMNYYNGYTTAAPHVITASATLASGDRAVQIGTISGTVALLMPDCTGPSGETYTIQNPQSAHMVTVAGGISAQPINGLTSAITIANNATVSLKILANSKTTAGCQWAM